jgi:hypothetical protein
MQVIEGGAVGSSAGTDEEYMRLLYLPGAWAAADLRAVQESAVYTAYWRQGIGMVVLDFVNRSLRNTRERFAAAIEDAAVQHGMERLDAAGAALTGGDPDAALLTYENCQCLMVDIYNRFYAQTQGFNQRTNRPITRLADGSTCPADTADVIAACQ